MTMRLVAGISVLALAAVFLSWSLTSASSSSADLGIAARLGHEQVQELRRTTSPEYWEAERVLAEALEVLEADVQTHDALLKSLEPFDRMLDLGSAGRWGEAKAVAEKFQLGYEHLLYRALSEGAPSDVIVELVESNGTLPDDAITTIASQSLNLKGWSGAAELARTLVQTHGLDVHFVDQQGRNALTIAAEYFYDIPGWDANRDSFELIEFLLDQSVTTKPDARGLDALDRILLAILDRPGTVRAGIELLRYLIGRGAPVELSHRQVAQIISASNAQAHARLIEAVPELL